MNPTRYIKLPGRASGIGSYHRSYLGPDHLLLVESTGFREKYRRCFFSDIQAIVIRPTLSGRITNLVALGIALCFLFSGVVAGGDALMVFSILSGVLGLMIVINLILGPTCHCTVKTQAQLHRVRSVGRLRAARKLALRLKPLIDEAQGITTQPGPAPTAGVVETSAPDTSNPPSVD